MQLVCFPYKQAGFGATVLRDEEETAGCSHLSSVFFHGSEVDSLEGKVALSGVH